MNSPFSGHFFNAFTLALALSFGLSLIPWGKYLLYPFKILTTWVHECSHAFMVVCVGGEVNQITLSPDTSGLTHFQLKRSRFRESLVASAGYLGASLVGCLIYYGSVAATAYSHHILLAMGILMLFSAVLWVRNFFGALVVISMGVGLIYGSTHPSHELVGRYLLPFLGTQIGLNSLFDIRTLFGLEPGSRSDAHTMQTLFWLPAAFWATLWMVLSLVMMGYTVKFSALGF